MTPQRELAQILLKARAASDLGVVANMSVARSHRLANTMPKIAGIKMKILKSNGESPGSRKGAVTVSTAPANSMMAMRAERAPQVFITFTNSIARGNEAAASMIVATGS